MYNFESSTGPTVPFSRGVNPDGRLLDPETIGVVLCAVLTTRI